MRGAFINKVLKKKVRFPLRVLTSVAGPCPRIIQRSLKILPTQLKSKTKEKHKCGEFSKFSFPSIIAGSKARAPGALLGASDTRGAPPSSPPSKNSPQNDPPKPAPGQREPSPAGEQLRLGPSRGEPVAPGRGGLRNQSKRTHGDRAPCRSQTFLLLRCPRGPSALPSIPKRQDTPSPSTPPRLRPSLSGGCPAARPGQRLPVARLPCPRSGAAADPVGGSSAFLIYGAAPGRRPGNVPSRGFFCRAPSYAPAALHF